MADVLKIDAHLHLYATKAIGAFEKGDYGIWEYGEKPGVKFSEYDGDLADTLEAMEGSGCSQGNRRQPVLDQGRDGASRRQYAGEDDGSGEGGSDQGG